MLDTRRKSEMRPGLVLARVARNMTGRFTFRKRLPAEFGGARIHVTARSDVRLLAPGFSNTAMDFCAAWKAGPQGKVFALEADPYYAELLHKTARTLPEHYASVVPLCAAVADRFSILELAIAKRGHSRNHLRIVSGLDADDTEAVKQVMAVTGDFLLAQWPKPDFVKVDIEGAELLFLAGASKVLSTARPGLYLEVSPSNRDLMTDLLLTHRYSLSRFGGRDSVARGSMRIQHAGATGRKSWNPTGRAIWCSSMVPGPSISIMPNLPPPASVGRIVLIAYATTSSRR